MLRKFEVGDLIISFYYLEDFLNGENEEFFINKVESYFADSISYRQVFTSRSEDNMNGESYSCLVETAENNFILYKDFLNANR